jgi:hypothetical protein
VVSHHSTVQTVLCAQKVLRGTTNSMLKILRFVQLFSPVACGFRMVQAAEAFETPPLNRSARRHALIATCSLLAGAALLLTAALIDTLAKARPLSEKVGFAGIVCLILCVHSGLCYKDANSRPPQNSN